MSLPKNKHTFRAFYQQKLVPLIRFGCTGMLASLVYYCIALSLHYFTQIPTMWGNSLAYFSGFLTSYIGQRTWTFNSKRPHKQTLPLFCLVSGIGFLGNSGIILLLLSYNVAYYIASFVAIICMTAISFFLMKFIVFTS